MTMFLGKHARRANPCRDFLYQHDTRFQGEQVSGLTFMVLALGIGFVLFMLRRTTGSTGGRLLTTLVFFVSFFVFGATFIGFVAVLIGQSESVRTAWSTRLMFLVPLSVACIWALWRLREWIR
ncbi:hypothetical protein HNQ60_005143 [Povalibacter uvarum]|uniref:Uncharacterized protein n=1 Tax=Povalibacter uvarum TaxID=732238 RepID=A0A841HS70_9GAMM|nr:hypothetical protein [Povalibacter uvarum]MBB6096221.1 hypothetical protein [Povalibacter uvarum]